LIERGLVKVRSFAGSKNKFGYNYMFTLRGLSEKAVLAEKFFRRKVSEYESLTS
jgi:MarR family transcriptional regulator, temperature-dependent positive regulator of motility